MFHNAKLSTRLISPRAPCHGAIPRDSESNLQGKITNDGNRASPLAHISVGGKEKKKICSSKSLPAGWSIICPFCPVANRAHVKIREAGKHLGELTGDITWDAFVIGVHFSYLCHSSERGTTILFLEQLPPLLLNLHCLFPPSFRQHPPKVPTYLFPMPPPDWKMPPLRHRANDTHPSPPPTPPLPTLLPPRK